MVLPVGMASELLAAIADVDKRLAVVKVRLNERAADRQASTEPPPS